MYLVGGEHPNKAAAQRLLERSITERERVVTDAEVFQEILHRYAAIGRRDAIGPAFEALRSVVDEVFPIEMRDVDRARRLVGSGSRVSARDAIHIAVMQRHDVPRVMSFDRGFDRVPGIVRVGD